MFDDRIGNLQKMLARMGPEGRQRYAADHADDPIAVSMALFVNNIAKEIKEGKRGEPEVQTPVVQQAIQAMNQPSMPPQGMPPQGQPQAPQQAQQAPQQAQQAPQAMPPQAPQQQAPQQQAPQQQRQTRMAADGGYMDSRLPEEMGIGALPERSLSNMADGGIIGYAETGLVSERWQDMKKLPNESGEDFARRVALARQASYQAQMFPTDEQKEAARKQALEKERAKNMAEVSTVDSMSLPSRPLGPYGAPTVPRQEGVLPNQAGSGGAEDPNGAGPPRPAAPPAARPAAATPTGAPPAANAAAGLQSLATKDLTAQDIVNARKDIAFLQDPVVDPLKEERQKIVNADTASGLEELQQHRERVAKQGDPYAKQEERANKQEASVAESAERNPYLALMEAGFAAMAGDSPYAMVNLGKGALAGTKTYRDGLALIEKAKEKLTETRDRIDGLRLIRSDLNASEERTILNQNRKTALDGTRFMFEGLAKATGESKAQIEANLKIFTDARAAKQLQEGENARAVLRDTGDTARNTASNAAAGVRNAASLAMQKTIAEMPGAQEKLYSALGGGDIKKGFKYWSEATAESKGDEALALAFAKDPMLLEGLKTSNPAAYAAFMSRMSGDTGFKVTGSRPAN